MVIWLAINLFLLFCVNFILATANLSVLTWQVWVIDFLFAIVLIANFTIGVIAAEDYGFYGDDNDEK